MPRTIGRAGRGLAVRLLAPCLLLAACSLPVPDSRPENVGRVIEVADGDTVVIRTASDDVRIRIFGIDAPESGQSYGAEARQTTRSLLLGRDVTVRQRDVDQYGRIVAELLLDGADVGATLIAAGAAWHYRAFSDSSEYAELEAQAYRERVGLWSDPEPVPPWTWRARTRDTESTGVVRVDTPFAGNRRSQIFHARGCPDFTCANCTVAFESAAAASAAGYRPHSCVREPNE
jgi:micrococcal nuclease